MKIQNTGSQNNLTFGTAFIRFSQQSLDELPGKSQRRIRKLLTKGVSFSKMSADVYSGSNKTRNKLVMKSKITGYTALSFTDRKNNPITEHYFLKPFKKLFPKDSLTTKVIENNAENKELIKKTQIKQQTWVAFNNDII